MSEMSIDEVDESALHEGLRRSEELPKRTWHESEFARDAFARADTHSDCDDEQLQEVRRRS